jgi:hypothetical protein
MVSANTHSAQGASSQTKTNIHPNVHNVKNTITIRAGIICENIASNTANTAGGNVTQQINQLNACSAGSTSQ